MKPPFYFPIALLLLCTPVFSGPFKKTPAQLDRKFIEAEARFAKLQANRKKAIPPVVLKHARGLIILRQIKAGFVFGAEAGGGVAMVRKADGSWSAPAFVSAGEASWGAQVGAQDQDVVMVITSEAGLNMLRVGARGNVGVEYLATMGPVDTGTDFDTDDLSPILVYSNAAGSFAGISLKGGGIVGAKKKNQTYYGLPIQEILFTRGAPVSQSASLLIRSVMAHSAR